ncbi:hypothetical protein Cgig2_030090 [Carnegiea gigantea]|uniref:DUF4283 domain-containing protein n=1 Tax=Carnegiea gigantea TaxID=171969 RepID=A0A9Q1GTJ4_9CARY|nr:hypothetical protein Cgig2_030090 [Carnegiea gigantea]
MVNPNEGSALKFVEASVIHVTKCAKIVHQDVEAEIEYWNQAVICCVLGANLPLGVVDGYVRRIWSQYGIDKVVATHKGIYLVRFKSAQDKEVVLSKCIYYFDQKPFIIKAWNENLELNTSSISSLLGIRRLRIKGLTKWWLCGKGFILYQLNKLITWDKEDAHKGIDKVVAARKGIYLVRFKSAQDKEAVLSKCIYYFDQKPLNKLITWDKETAHKGIDKVVAACKGIYLVRFKSAQDKEAVLSKVINRTKCAKIEDQDVEAEIEYWNQVVICCVLRANPPLGVIDGYVRRIWSQYEIDKVVAARKGIYLVRFKSAQDKEAVLSKVIYYFDQKSFIIKAWNENLELDTISISSLRIWVQFPELDGVESLSKLGSLPRIPLKTDKQTMEKVYISYARLLIDIHLDGTFPDYVDFITDKGIVTKQRVKYEWRPLKRSHCNTFAHFKSDCRKRRTDNQNGGLSQPGIKTLNKKQSNNH